MYEVPYCVTFSLHLVLPLFRSIYSPQQWAGRPDSIPGRSRNFFSLSLRPDRLWGPPSLLSNACRWFFSRG